MKKVMKLILSLSIVLGIILALPSVVYAMPQQSTAISWLKTQANGAVKYDVDGIYGYQCSDFATAYINYLIDGNPWSGRYTTYNGYQYFNITYPTGWQKIANYDALVPEPGDILVFNGTSNNPNGHVCVAIEGCTTTVYKAVGQNGAENWKGTQYQTGKYFDSYNSFRGVIRPKFTSIPTNPTISISQNQFTVGTSVTFSFSAGNATGFTIGIDKDSVRVDTKACSSSYSRSFSEAGNYSAYVTAWNADGAVDSSRVSFTVTPKNTSSVTDFVTRLYSCCLNRSPESAGLTFWTNSLTTKQNTGANVAYGFFFSQEFLNRNLSDSAYIDVLYKAFFNRDPDSAGKANWLAFLQNGCSREFVFAGFVSSQEWKNLCSTYIIDPGTYKSTAPRDQNPSVTAFVQRLYQVCLGRSNDVNGLNYWTQRLLSKSTNGATVAYGFVFSAESTAKNLSNDAFANLLYMSLFNRVPSSSEKEGWLRLLNSGTSRQSIFNGFINSTEFSNLCSKYGIVRGSL